MPDQFPTFRKVNARLEAVVDRRQTRLMPRVPAWMIKLPIVFGIAYAMMFTLPYTLVQIARKEPVAGVLWVFMGLAMTTFAIIGTAFAVREKRRRASLSAPPVS